MEKRTLPQGLFDSPMAKRIIKQAFAEADREREAKHKAGIFDEGDPDHPKYNNGINYATGLPLRIFGYETAEFMAKQYN